MNHNDIFLRPFVQMIPASIKPSHLTVSRILLSIPIVIAILYGWLLIGAFLFILGILLDALDGALARTRHETSAQGAVLDPIADKTLFAASFIPLGFALLPANLFIAICILEIVTVLGTAATTSAWIMVYKKQPFIQAHRCGKYKTACYSIATLFLFFAAPSIIVFVLSILLFYLGLLAGVLSIVEHSLYLSKN